MGVFGLEVIGRYVSAQTSYDNLCNNKPTHHIILYNLYAYM